MGNLATHYDPFSNPNDDETFSDYGYCGTYIIDGNSTGDKDLVCCKKCIKKFKQADAELQQARNSQLKDMQGFVDFMEKELTIKEEK
ncbi:hypothetical protein HHL23_09400 [Chryseobacterium sp. RP-3-3]|uniref:Uncharacterized protein n=1 Tax=Chryseobacterium antibioticum TaxID=2728847 RepID=A0A7Y0AMH6_9FLAO|nr:hypothetical protein [Chryseobacterium antibioticum]NML70015.1 hypothetical protein [Chryseobacterium antibioticum]